jgi:hypothetical protein
MINAIKRINFVALQAKPNPTPVSHEEYTTQALIDKLTVNLGSIKTEIIPADTSADPIEVSKYYWQARRLVYWLPVLKVPSNEFVINLSDLSGKIRQELKGLDSKTLQYVLKQSVTKIFENIDADAYHSRSLGKNLRVRLEA